jgi:biopolymer transport protein ExbB
MFFLQIDQSSVALSDTAAAGSTQSVSLFDLALKGGPVMVPIFILFFIAIFILIEKILTLQKARKNPPNFLDQVKRMVLNGEISAARAICNQTNTPVSRMIEKGISKIGSPLKNIETSIENVGKIEIYNLEKNLSLLGTIAGAAPMLGFLGTVTGMIQAFMQIAQVEGQVSPKLLSSGMYEAMITTVAGLIVGVIAFLAYNFLVARVQKIVHQMEYTSFEFIDLLQEPTKDVAISRNR